MLAFALALSTFALILSTSVLVRLVRLNKTLHGRYFPPGGPK